MEDMALQGLPVTVIMASLDKGDQELKLLLARQVTVDPKVPASTAEETQQAGRTQCFPQTENKKCIASFAALPTLSMLT